MATLVQVLAIFTGFLGPLIIWFMAKPEQPFVKHHAAEALNFQITVTIAAFVSGLLMLVLIGFLLLPVVLIGALVLEVMAALESGIGSRSTCGWCPGPRAEADVGAGSCQAIDPCPVGWVGSGCPVRESRRVATKWQDDQRDGCGSGPPSVLVGM